MNSKRGKSERWRLARALVTLASVTFAAPAAAKPDFPGVIQAHWGGDCAPLCTLCHTRAEGGASEAEPYLKPSALDERYDHKDLGNNRGEGEFFANLIGVNKRAPTSNEALVMMLGALDTSACSVDATVPGNTMAPCDSDGDELQDTKEFGLSKDPDAAGGELCIGPKYGCGASISRASSGPSSHRGDGLLLAGFGAVLVLLRRAGRRP